MEATRKQYIEFVRLYEESTQPVEATNMAAMYSFDKDGEVAAVAEYGKNRFIQYRIFPERALPRELPSSVRVEEDLDQDGRFYYVVDNLASDVPFGSKEEAIRNAMMKFFNGV
jgi:hypothetical protein